MSTCNRLVLETLDYLLSQKIFPDTWCRTLTWLRSTFIPIRSRLQIPNLNFRFWCHCHAPIHGRNGHVRRVGLHYGPRSKNLENWAIVLIGSIILDPKELPLGSGSRGLENEVALMWHHFLAKSHQFSHLKVLLLVWKTNLQAWFQPWVQNGQGFVVSKWTQPLARWKCSELFCSMQMTTFDDLTLEITFETPN